MKKEQAIALVTDWIFQQYGSAGRVVYAIELRDDSKGRGLVERSGLDLSQVGHLWGTWFVGFKESGVESTTHVVVDPTTRRICLQSELT